MSQIGSDWWWFSMRWCPVMRLYGWQVPPAGAFSWRPESVLVKDSGQKVDGWQLAGMVQYDAWGQPAFLHRCVSHAVSCWTC